MQAVFQFDKVTRICQNFPPAIDGQIRSFCARGHYLQARTLLQPLVLGKMGVEEGSREHREMCKKQLPDLLRILMKRSPEVGLLHLYVESHISAIGATGFGSRFQRRVHEMTPSGLLLRPPRSYEETKHGNRPDLAGAEAVAQQTLWEFANKANKAGARSRLGEQLREAVQVARQQVAALDAWFEEVGPVTIAK